MDRADRPTPVVVEHDPVAFVVDHRMPGPAGGPTLRVRRLSDDRELLRFDCFARGAHWHADPAGRDEITQLPAEIDALEWTVDAVHRDLPDLLARAGGPAVETGSALAERLDRVEAALRNPPAVLDGLEEAVLRQRTGEKWQTYPPDVLPLWVADMDFPVAEPIRRTLQRHLDLGDLGYPLHPAPTDVPDVFAARAERRYGWKVDPGAVDLLTDVMQGVYTGLETLSEPGDGVILQTPVYKPFFSAVAETRRTKIENPLREGEGGYRVDLDHLRDCAGGARVLLLCNPQNPTGRVLGEDELRGIAEIACDHDLWVVSDEIHADLVYPGRRHVPFASLGPEVAERTLSLHSASKAFNIAGLRTSVCVFGSEEIRRRFRQVPRHVRGGMGALGIQATLVAWRHADPWLAEVLAYLEANRDFTVDFVRRELPGMRCLPPEATYLMWLDARALDLDRPPHRFFYERAKVALSAGPAFGPPGEGFVRLNIATSRAILERALGRMAAALRSR